MLTETVACLHSYLQASLNSAHTFFFSISTFAIACNSIANHLTQFFSCHFILLSSMRYCNFYILYRAVAENFILSPSFWIFGISFILSMHMCDLYCFFNRSLKGLFKMTTATESASVHQKYMLYFPGFRIITRKQLPSQSHIPQLFLSRCQELCDGSLPVKSQQKQGTSFIDYQVPFLNWWVVWLIL